MAKTTPSAPSPASQPPYIKRAHLRNVPPLRDVQVDFQPGLNIIIGKNGSGKTNFMKLLSELADMYSEKYRGVGCEVTFGGSQDVKIEYEKQVTAPEAKESFLSRISVNHQSLITVASSSKEKKERSELLIDAFYNLTGPRFRDYSIVTVWHGIPAYRLPLIDINAELVFSKSTGLLTGSDEDMLRIWSSRLVRILYNALDGINLQTLFAEESGLEAVRQHITQTISLYLNRLNPYIKLYSPLEEIQLSPHFQVYRNLSKDEVLIKGLLLEYKIEGDWLPFSALSDGTKRISYLIGELLTDVAGKLRGQEELTFINSDKIIFLEEPELGIHPDQLQLLLQLIREVSKEHQIIMTTHSPQTLDMLNRDELDRITICEFIPGKGTQMRKLSPAKQAKAKAYLRDEGFLSEFWRFSNLEDPD
jgi:ABC-type multidrug transport system ATPase subunit